MKKLLSNIGLLRAVFAVVMLTVVCFVALGYGATEQRFSKPVFEKSYNMPVVPNPGYRFEWRTAADIFVLIAALSLSAWLAFKKRSRTGIVILSIASLIYFGFYKKGCICPIGSVQNMVLAISDSAYAVPLLVIGLFTLPLIFSVFFGRVFCGGVCPQGALQDLVLIKPVKIPAWLESTLELGAYAFLGLTVMFTVSGKSFILCQFDPFVPLFRLSGTLPYVMLSALFIFLSFFVGRPYCRFLCPYGLLLKLVSRFNGKTVTITPDDCVLCGLCKEACPYGAINMPHKEESLGRNKRLGIVLICLGAVLFMSLLGFFSGRFLARFDKRVELARQVVLYKGQDQAFKTYEYDAFRAKGITEKPVIEAAEKVIKSFEKSGLLFGIWMGFASVFIILGLFRRKDYKIYEPEPGLCVSCGRCFSYCPKERERLGKAAKKTES
jgi:ferredoxin